MKKRYGVLILIFFILINNNLIWAKGISKDIKPVIEEKKIEENTDYIEANLSIPNIITENNTVGKSITEKINNDILIWRSDLTDLAHKYEEDFKKDNIVFRKFQLLTKYYVSYNKNNILSIPINYYQYTGGAHGLTTKISYNYDLNSGELFKLRDLFEENSTYKSKIDNYIRSEIKKDPQIYFNSGEEFKGIKDSQDFYLDNDGLVIYFQLYEIAPYSSGIREFKIPYDLLKDDLKYKLN